MKRYKIYHSKSFNENLKKFPGEFQIRLDKIEEQLAENPYAGDPLGTRWFREKRIEKYRVYFLIYEDLKIVFIVAISDKKDQQKTINTIRLLFDVFREEVENLTKGGFI